MVENQKPVDYETVVKFQNRCLCRQCGMFRANLDHPEKLCVYCVLNVTRRDKIFDGDEAPGIGDS